MKPFTKQCLNEAFEAFPIQGKKVVLIDPLGSDAAFFLRSKGAEVIGSSEGKLGFYVFMLSTLTESSKDLGLEDVDLQLMQKAKSKMAPGGLLFVCFPIAQDGLIGDSYRVYGEYRMKRLLQGFRPVGYFGYSYEDVLRGVTEAKEPIIVLKAI